MTKIKDFIKKYWREMVLILVAALFFVGTSRFNYQTQGYAQTAGEIDFVKWLSPDETSNYIFTKLFAQTGNISIVEDYNLKTKEIMHPRSFRSDFGTLKPVSFLGIILIYGKIASVFSYKVIPYLTPLLAGLAIIFFYLLLKRLFDRNIAFISALILSVFPAYTYYSARSMFHNVLLVVLLIISAYLGMLMVEKNTKDNSTNWLGMLFASLSGLFIGLAITSRVSELLWIAPCLFIIWVFNVRKIGFVRLALFVSFLFLAILPNLYYNQILYGSAISGGYNEMNESLRNITTASKGLVSNAIESGEAGKHQEQLNLIKKSIFHFGIHPRQSLKMLGHYFVEMFSYIFWPAAAGFIIFFGIRVLNTKKRHWIYLLSLLITSFILILYYGSWKFHDNPDPNSFTIGNSYTRYWLPVYLGSFPFVAILIVSISNVFVWIKNRIFSLSTGRDIIASEGNSREKFSWSSFISSYKELLRTLGQTRLLRHLLSRFTAHDDQEADTFPDDKSSVQAEVSQNPNVWVDKKKKQGAATEALVEKNNDKPEQAKSVAIIANFFSSRLRDSILKFAVQAVLVMGIAFLSIQYVLFGSEEGLIYTIQKQSLVRTEWAKVIELTPHNSTLITRYHDKLFFPERKVIVGEFDDQNMVIEYRNLVNYLPVYYYNFTLPPASVKWLNEKRLGEVGLGIKLVEEITQDFSLYELYLDDTYLLPATDAS